MTYGMSKAKVKVIAGIDSDENCRNAYLRNNKGSQFIHTPIENLTPSFLKSTLGIRKNQDNLLLIGCSPCQFWSKLKTNKKKSEGSAYLLLEFLRFIEELRPGWVVVENVPGIVSKKGSILPRFVEALGDLGYSVTSEVLDLTKYGVPQTRHRFVLLASRLTTNLKMPNETHAKPISVSAVLGTTNGFPPVIAGHIDTSPFLHTVSNLSEGNLRRIQITPKNGGMRRNCPSEKNLHVDSYTLNPKNFSDVYARMSWSKPAPTITTRFNSFSNGRFGHPEEDRAISLREGATLQTFPKTYKFFGPLQGIAKQIGNAVPPRISLLIGKHLTAIYNNLPR